MSLNWVLEHVAYANEVYWWNKINIDSYTKILTIIETSMNGNNNNNNGEKKNIQMIIIASK